MVAGDVEFKQNKVLPAEKQIITAYPDITTVCSIWTCVVSAWIGVMICGIIF
jgi:hypothetical protein